MKNEFEIISTLREDILIFERGVFINFFGIYSGRVSSTFALFYRYSLIRVLLVFGILFSAGSNLSAQSKLDKSGSLIVYKNGKNNSPGLEAAKIPSGLSFPSDLEKVYGDSEYELGQEFDTNGMLIKYSAEDTSILQINGNWGMILKSGETKVYAEIAELQDVSNSIPLTQNLKVYPGTLKLTVLPDQKKVFGDLDPDFSVEISGLVYGQGSEIVSGSPIREQGENVGSYRINQGNLDAGENYQVEFIGSDFQILERELTVEAQPTWKYFGADDPQFMYMVKGIDSDELGQIFTGQLSRQDGEHPGEYLIEVGELKVDSNYKIAFQEAIFEIKAAELSAIFDPNELETAWSIMPELPSHIEALTLDGQILDLPVSWQKSELNLFEKGTFFISGLLELPIGLVNPLLLVANQKLTILPKPRPEDLLLSLTKFEPVTTKSLILVG